MVSLKEMLANGGVSSPFTTSSDTHDVSWFGNDNSFEIQDDDWMSEPQQGTHLKIKDGYKVRLRARFEVPEKNYNVQEIYAVNEDGDEVDITALTIDYTQDKHSWSANSDQMIEFWLSGGEYLSIDVSGETNDTANFRIKKNWNAGQKYDIKWSYRGDGPVETEVKIDLMEVRADYNATETDWYAIHTWPELPGGGRVVYWEKARSVPTWFRDAMDYSRTTDSYSNMGGGNGNLPYFYQTNGEFYLNYSDYLWVPQSFVDFMNDMNDPVLAPQGGGVKWVDGGTQDLQTAIEWGTQWHLTYVEIYYQIAAREAATGEDLTEEEEESTPSDYGPGEFPDDMVEDVIDDIVEETPTRPPWSTGDRPKTLRMIYDTFHAGRTGGINSESRGPFYQFLLYNGPTATSQSGYEWMDSNTVKIIDHSEVDAGWYDFINNEENLDTTGAIRMVPHSYAKVTLEVYSPELGTLTVVLDGREETYGDMLEVDVDQNVDGIEHLKITSEGRLIIDEDSGFNENFEIHMVSYQIFKQNEDGTWEEDETVTPPDPDSGVYIPPFNWGDLIIVSLMTVGALYLTAWILRRSGGASNG